MKTIDTLLATTLLTGLLALPAAIAAAPVAGGKTVPSSTPCIGSDGRTQGDKTIASGSPETHKINPQASGEAGCVDDSTRPGHDAPASRSTTPGQGTGRAPKPSKPLRDSSGPQADEPRTTP